MASPVRMLQLAYACVLVLGLAGTSQAQISLPQPLLKAIFPAGAQVGTTVEVKLTNTTLLEGADQLVFSHPGITAKPVMQEADRFYPRPRHKEGVFSVTVAANVPPGTYEVHAAGPSGVSGVRKFVVGTLPEVLATDNHSPDKAQLVEIGSILNGQFTANLLDYYRFLAKRGQRIVIDCQSDRLNSQGDAMLTLRDASGNELTRSQTRVGRDPMIGFTAPADGEYVLCVRELTFGNYGSGVSTYRVTLATTPWIDFIDPPLAQRGTTGTFTLYGHNLGGTPSDVVLDGQRLEKLSVKISVPQTAKDASGDLLIRPSEASVEVFAYRHQSSAGLSNPVRIALADRPVVRESEPNNNPEKAQAVTLPLELVGRFDRPGDQDWYTFTAKSGDQLSIEIDSQRLGMPTNPLVVVQQLTTNGQGETTARDVLTLDDHPTLSDRNLLLRYVNDDPSGLFTAPQDGTYRILVRDLYGSSQGGPELFYRLQVQTPEPDFQLITVSHTPNSRNRSLVPEPGQMRPGGSTELHVLALRRGGFEGDIDVTAQSLPPGVTASRAIIPEKGIRTVLVLRAAPGAKPWTGSIGVVGKAKLGEKEQSRVARSVEMLWLNDQNMPSPGRLNDRIPLAIENSASVPCRIEVADPKVWRTARGGKLEVPVKLVKQDNAFKGTVALQPIGTVTNLRPAAVSLTDAKPDGKFVIDVNTNVPAGRFTLHLRGEVQIDYERNKQIADQAKLDKERLDKLSKDWSDLYRKSTAERQKLDQAATQALRVRDTANSKKSQLTAASQQAAALVKTAAFNADKAKQTLDAANKRVQEITAQVQAAGDENAKKAAQATLAQAQQQATQAKTAADAATKQAADLTAKAKLAEAELAKGDAALKAAEKALLEANEAKKKGTEAEQKAKADVDAVTAEVRNIDTHLRNMTNIARKQKAVVAVHSDPIPVEIALYPAEVNFNSESVTVVAGEKFELIATSKRDFGYDGEITLQSRLPGGVRLEGGNNNKIAKGQNQTKLQFTVDKTAKPGTYPMEFTIGTRFNNRPLGEKRTIEITIKPAPVTSEKK